MPSAHYTLKPSRYSSHSRLLEWFPQGSAQRVLDVGCGNGYFAELVAARGYQVTGIERKEGVSHGFPPSVQLVETDLEQGLPPLDGLFDVIVCADILEHLRDPARLLRELRAVLKPGGMLLASLPNSGNFYFRLIILMGRFPQDEKGLFDRTHVRFLTWAGWSALLEEAGFRIRRVVPAPVPFSVQWPRWEGSVPVRCAEGLFYQLARLRKQLFAYQFVVEARPVQR